MALGLNLGSIEEGKLADIMLVKWNVRGSYTLVNKQNRITKHKGFNQRW